MYIMCVCLFSTLSRRVGALQLSIIIIMQACTISPPKCTTITVLQGPFSVRLSNSDKNWEFPSQKQDHQRQIAENKLTPRVVAQGISNPSDQVHRTCSCWDFLHKHTSRSIGDWKTGIRTVILQTH